MVSKHSSPVKGTSVPREIVDFKARVGKTEGELGTFCPPERKEVFKKQKEQGMSQKSI